MGRHDSSSLLSHNGKKREEAPDRGALSELLCFKVRRLREGTKGDRGLRYSVNMLGHD